MIYLLKSQSRNGSWFKVGYTLNLAKRLLPYYTHNPNVELLESIKTYHKTKHKLEIEIQQEIINKGYEFKISNNGKREWFFVPLEQEQEFENKGLAQFKACKGRKIRGE